ncbi:hypothetical protein JQC91_03365 [Jannaschia sp. Os4]|uniref:hypothetical protein n=1 Tax=Jannaschia sp. Os4 TaxID=2807617 RepID=UPI001939369E|nr:hypothetical protein [Jannaschia sp. Os4]MBM2575334.1 hypothetical protein [Jannaschia sp. Os4]
MTPPPALLRDAASAVEAALGGGHRLVATLDGALLEDVGEALDALGIHGRPLMSDTMPRAQRDAGPWMVLPDRATADPMAGVPTDDDPERMAAALAEAAARAAERDEDSPLFAPPRPVAVDARTARQAWSGLLERHADAGPVIWAFPGGTDTATIRRHLRGLNLIRLARRPRPRHPNPTGEEEVAFRHADARVVAALVPLLRPAQVARLLGPAAAALAVAPDGVFSIVASQDGLAAPEGPLALDAAQVDLLEEPRFAPLDAAILRTVVADHGAVDDDATAARVRHLRRTAVERTAFRADQHLCDLVEVMWRHGAEILDRPDVAALLGRKGWSQERRCATLRRRLLAPAAEPA